MQPPQTILLTKIGITGTPTPENPDASKIILPPRTALGFETVHFVGPALILTPGTHKRELNQKKHNRTPNLWA